MTKVEREAIRARDASSGDLWFTGPASFTAQGARDRRELLKENDELRALVKKGLAVVHDFLPNVGRCVLQDYQRLNEFCAEAAALEAP